MQAGSRFLAGAGNAAYRGCIVVVRGAAGGTAATAATGPQRRITSLGCLVRGCPITAACRHAAYRGGRARRRGRILARAGHTLVQGWSKFTLHSNSGAAGHFLGVVGGTGSDRRAGRGCRRAAGADGGRLRHGRSITRRYSPSGRRGRYSCGRLQVLLALDHLKQLLEEGLRRVGQEHVELLLHRHDQILLRFVLLQQGEHVPGQGGRIGVAQRFQHLREP